MSREVPVAIGVADLLRADGDDNEDDVDIAEAEQKNPWPYLNDLFKFKSTDDKHVKMLCLTYKKDVTAYANSSSNLRKHLFVSNKLATANFICYLYAQSVSVFHCCFSFNYCTY